MNPFRKNDTRDYYAAPEKKYPDEYWKKKALYNMSVVKLKRRQFRLVYSLLVGVLYICGFLFVIHYGIEHKFNSDNMGAAIFSSFLGGGLITGVLISGGINLHACGDDDAVDIAKGKVEMEHQASKAE